MQDRYRALKYFAYDLYVLARDHLEKVLAWFVGGFLQTHGENRFIPGILFPLVKPPVPALRRFSDFRRVFETYHDRAVPSDTLTYAYVYMELRHMRQRQGPPNEYEVQLLLDGYLRSWGSMARVVGSSRGKSDPLLRRVGRILANEWSKIRRLQSSSVWDASDVPSDVASLFDALNDALRTRTSKGKFRGSPVGAAKLLHMLAPNVCIIWDRKWVLTRGLSRGRGVPRASFDEDGEGYSEYLREKFNQLRIVAENERLSVRRLANQVVSTHGRGLKEMFPRVSYPLHEPITKILDEANYL